ncbi:MAG: hypothetical protein GY795_32990 [Desulfobacterales bacterium]|nr:hypothetical protein [Desulfobacterales bacterium]
MIETFRFTLLHWFEDNGRDFPWRKKSATNYKKIISEILLQRTRAETVAKLFPVFVKAFPSWKKLANANKSELRKNLQPLGLWHQRSKRIIALSNKMKELGGRFPKERKKIENLPGVGQYIANSIQLFCHNVPRPLLDGNMTRVVERYFGPRKLADIRDDPYLQQISQKIVEGDKSAFINWAILDLAALVCTARVPMCENCPLSKECRTANKQVRQKRLYGNH